MTRPSDRTNGRNVIPTRLQPITLSISQLAYLVSTLLLLGAVVGIIHSNSIHAFYSERVLLPVLEKEFGFTLKRDPAIHWMFVGTITPGGVFDRLGIRVDDGLLNYYHGPYELIDLLEEARQGRRVRLEVLSRDQWRQGPVRCTWIDVPDLRAHPAKRLTPDTATCNPAEGAR